jgi:hypothetical protein
MSYYFSLNTGNEAVSETQCLIYCLLRLFILKHQTLDEVHEGSKFMRHTKSSEPYMNLCYVSQTKHFPKTFISAHNMLATKTERAVRHEKNHVTIISFFFLGKANSDDRTVRKMHF